MWWLLPLVAAASEEACGAEQAEGSSLLQLRSTVACNTKPVELQKSARFCHLDGLLLALEPLERDEPVRGFACDVYACCDDLAAAVQKACPGVNLPARAVECVSSAPGEEDLDTRLRLLNDTYLHDTLGVSLTTHQLHFAGVTLPCSIFEQKNRVRRLIPPDVDMPPAPDPTTWAAPLDIPAPDPTDWSPPAPTPSPADAAAEEKEKADAAAAAELKEKAEAAEATEKADKADAAEKTEKAEKAAAEEAAELKEKADAAEAKAKADAKEAAEKQEKAEAAAAAEKADKEESRNKVPSYEPCEIRNGGRSYADLGRGKCSYLDGRDFGTLEGHPDLFSAFLYKHKAGRKCEQYCDEDEDCCGYSVSQYHNCLLWRKAVKKSPREWGGAHCMAKR